MMIKYQRGIYCVGARASRHLFEQFMLAVPAVADEIKGDELVPARRPASLNGSIAELLLCYSLFSHTI